MERAKRRDKSPSWGEGRTQRALSLSRWRGGAEAEENVSLEAATGTVDRDGDSGFRFGNLGSPFPARAAGRHLWRRVNEGTTKKGVPAFSLTARGVHGCRELDGPWIPHMFRFLRLNVNLRLHPSFQRSTCDFCFFISPHLRAFVAVNGSSEREIEFRE